MTTSVTGPPNDGREEAELQPWQVPSVSDEALAEELPEEVAAAARRALQARRPGVAVAELREQRVEADGTAVYSFGSADLVVELRVSHGPDRPLLRISSTGCRAADVEVLHGSAPTHLALDSSGSATLEVDDGLVSVVLSPASGGHAPVQTSWIRIP